MKNTELKEDVFKIHLWYFFDTHQWNLNDDLIDKIRCMLEDEFLKRYWYNKDEIDFDLLVEKASEEVWEMTTFWILRELDVEKQKKITDLLIAKKNVKELLEKPNCLIDMHGLEYWAGVVERKRKEVRELF